MNGEQDAHTRARDAARVLSPQRTGRIAPDHAGLPFPVHALGCTTSHRRVDQAWFSRGAGKHHAIRPVIIMAQSQSASPLAMTRRICELSVPTSPLLLSSDDIPPHRTPVLSGAVGRGVRTAFRRFYSSDHASDDDLLAQRIRPLLMSSSVVLDAGCGSGAMFSHNRKVITRLFVGCDIGQLCTAPTHAPR